MNKNKRLRLSDKILFEFYFHVMECLRLWTNDDPALMEYYIKNDVTEMYKNIVREFITITDDGQLLCYNPESLEIECCKTEDNYVYFTYDFDLYNETDATLLDFYRIFSSPIDGMSSVEFKIDMTKYSYVPNGISFIIEIYYRIYLASILMDYLFKLRNKINHINIKKADQSELIASSLFCRTVLLDLINGMCVTCEEYRYEIIDTFGMTKEISFDIYINKTTGEVIILNLGFDF